MGNVDPRFAVAAVCEKYGWTYLEYLEQPEWFLDVIAIKMDIEAKVRAKKEQELERNVNRTRR